MFSRLSKQCSIKNILVISLTNIGDVLMASPVVDVLCRDFPNALVHVVTGPKAVSVYAGNSRITPVVFDKHWLWPQKMRWFFQLRRLRPDIVVDLRNTIVPFMLQARFTTPLGFGGKFQGHLKDKFLARLRTVYDFGASLAEPVSIEVSGRDRQYVNGLLASTIGANERFVVIASRAADLAKTWSVEGFGAVAKALIEEHKLKVVLLGSREDQGPNARINACTGGRCLDLSGATNLVQAAGILKRACLALVHDSGLMHIASYLNVPVVALFGPTDPSASSPWSSRFQVVRRNGDCVRCREPHRVKVLHNCMSGIRPEDVLSAVSAVILRSDSDEESY